MHVGFKKLLAGLVLLTLCLFCACQKAPASEKPTVTGSFEVTVLDIGKADAILLYTAHHTVLIDSGSRGDGKDILDELSARHIDTLDYMMITHFDQDHVGGAVKVLNNISVKTILTPDYEGNNDEYQRYLDIVQAKELTPVKLRDPLSFTLDDVAFSVYPPLKESYEESDNDYSLVVSAVHGKNTFLFAGDAQATRLSELPSQLPFLKHTFLKVPHHGNLNRLSEWFLKSVQPEWAVITCGEKTPPDDELTKILSSVGSTVYLSSSGSVYAVSDGETLSLRQES